MIVIKNSEPEEDTTLKYCVNLIVDHSESQGAPVIVTFNPKSLAWV